MKKGRRILSNDSIPRFNVPILHEIPFIGPLFFKGIYGSSILAIAIAFLAWFIIYKTPFGLRLRSVGEHPMAADTMGINVTKIRYIAVIISGGLAGIGGAIYSQTMTNDFGHATINGQGFMALAAMIFGKWHPIGAMGAALFFGFAQALAISASKYFILGKCSDCVSSHLAVRIDNSCTCRIYRKSECTKSKWQPYIKGNR